MSGWIKLHRSIKENWVYDNPEYLKAWITILMDVNHKGNKVLLGAELVDCPRGSSLNSLSTWASKFGHNWTIRKVRTFLKLLEKDTMIDRQGLSKTTRLSVCNYSTYQDTCQANDTQSDKQTTNKRQTDDNKQEGKENQKKKEVIEYLNKATGKNFRVAKGLQSRLDEGYTLDDCKKVIDIKCSQWLNDEKMKSFLRPDTLFSLKFDGYLNETPTKTFKDHEYLESCNCYLDRDNKIVYDSAGNISSEFFWDSTINSVGMI